MDLGYILLNTIIYGTVAMVITSFFSFGKILNFSIGTYIMMLGYILYSFITSGFLWINLILFVVVLASFLFVNWALLKYFPNDKKRDHVGLIVSLGVSILLENFISRIFGPTSVGLSGLSIPLPVLVIIFVVLLGLFFYLYRYTFLGISLNAISEDSKLVRGIGIETNKLLQYVFAGLFSLCILCAYLLLTNANLKAGDGTFYMIKGIGIMILVGTSKKQFIYFGALGYVLLEYFLFVSLGLPISYKETLILVIILLVLLLKPEGLFSFRKRAI